MAKRRYQLFRAKKYKEKREIDPNRKPLTFWESLEVMQRVQDFNNERRNELGRMICKAEMEKLRKAINS